MDELSYLNFGSRTLYLRDDGAREEIADLYDQLVNGSVVTAHDIQTASFYDTAGGMPLASLLLNIAATQNGSGTPSPTNQRAFSGFSTCHVMHSGADISQPETIEISFPSGAGVVYNGTLDVVNGKLRVTKIAKTIAGDSDIADFNISRLFAVITLPGISSAGVNTTAELETIQCDRFYTLRTDETWNNFDLYIAKYDNSSNVVIKYADVFTSRANAAAWFASNPTTILYTLAEPIEYTFDPVTILTLQGANSIWTDVGNIGTIGYRMPPSSGGSASGGGSRPFLRVLAFGNSFTYSTLEYLPYLLEELLPDTEVVMGICYDAGCTLARHVTKFNGGDIENDIPAVYAKYSEYTKTAHEWINVDSVYTAQRALDKYEWDIIVLQQSVENLEYFDDLSIFADLLSRYVTYPVMFLYNMAQARHANDTSWLPSKYPSAATGVERSNLHYNDICKYAEQALATSYISGVLPCATAVQNLRTTSIAANIGESGWLAKDNSGHLQEGLGPLCSGYAAAYQLLNYIGETPKIYGLKLAPTDEWMEETNVPFQTATGPCVGITASNKIVAQKCAMAAIKHPFTIDKSGLAEADLYQLVLQDGYLTASGTLGAADSSRQEKTTNRILATQGDQLIIDYEIPVEHAMWGCYLLTDSANCPLSREILINAIGTSFHTEITITDPKAKYIAFSFRSYGNANAFAVASKNRLNTYEKTFSGYDSFAISNANSLVNSVNHRGYSTLYPENTAIAYEKSAANGFKMVETDIQFTADGIPVCLHDNAINRTGRNSDGSELENTISINDLTYAQALEYDFGIFKGSIFAGTQILSFENFIALCRRLGLHPYIELKNDGNYIAENYVTLVNIVKAYGMIRKVTWIASDTNNLQAILALDAKARLGRVASSITNSLVNQILSLRTSDNEVFIDCKFSALTSESIASLIANDIPLEVWTLDDPATMRTLDPYVSGCTSNRYAFGAVLASS